MTTATTPELVSAPPKYGKVGTAPTTKSAIRDRIGKLFDNNSGQLHLRDVLKEARSGAAAPLCTATAKNGSAILTFPTASTIEAPIQTEERTGKSFAITLIPAHLLSVDEVVNPRHLQ